MNWDADIAGNDAHVALRGLRWMQEGFWTLMHGADAGVSGVEHIKHPEGIPLISRHWALKKNVV